MPGELNIINEISDSAEDFLFKEISSKALRIGFLKNVIERSLIKNHECTEEHLEFLLK